MEIPLETLVALAKNETVTVTIEDAKGDFSLTQSPDKFVIEAEDIRLEIGRPCGSPLVAALTAWELLCDFLGDWPEN